MIGPGAETFLPMIVVGMAFAREAREALLKRDHYSCRSGCCFGNYINMGVLNRHDGWHINAAHYPLLHQPQEDRDIGHGRCLCVTCHMIEEIQRNNDAGARLLYSNQTIRTTAWLSYHRCEDWKMPLDFYYDFARASSHGREGLALAYTDRFNSVAVKQGRLFPWW